MNWEARTMRSKTFCFNSSLYRRTVLRLWPIWAAGIAIFFFALPANLWQAFANGGHYLLEAGPSYLAQDSVYSMAPVIPVTMAVLGCVTALFVWNWMFTARSANCYFSLPLRREGLYLTNFLAGLTVCLIPLVVTFVLTVAVEVCFGGLEVVSLLRILGSAAAASLLFFSIVTVCAVVTGNIVAMPAFFILINFLAFGLFRLIHTLLETILFGMGYAATPDAVLWLSPIIQLMRSCYAVNDAVIFINNTYAYYAEVSNLWYYAVYAGAGVVLALVGMLAFRRRPAEAAGDLIAFRWLRPVFQIGLSLCFAAAMALFIQSVYLADISFPVTLILIAVWSFVGWFGAEMLLKKTFRVFRARSLRTWGITAAAALVLLTAVRLDLFGYVRYMPDESEVETVEISAFGSTIQADYATAAQLHTAILDGTRDGADFYIDLHYTLRSGREVVREYTIGRNTQAAQLLFDWYTQPEVAIEAVFGTMESIDQLSWISINIWETGDWAELEGDSETAAALIAAIRADLLEGNNNLLYGYGISDLDAYGTVEIVYYREPYSQDKYGTRAAYQSECRQNYSYLEITENMTHTVALLESLDFSALSSNAAIDVVVYD